MDSKVSLGPPPGPPNPNKTYPLYSDPMAVFECSIKREPEDFPDQSNILWHVIFLQETLVLMASVFMHVSLNTSPIMKISMRRLSHTIRFHSEEQRKQRDYVALFKRIVGHKGPRSSLT
jgi:hypothetical protein